MESRFVPHEIEKRSFEIIDGLVDFTGYSPAEAALVKRVIHATGSPEFSSLIRWSPGAIQRGVEAIKSGAAIVADVNMLRAGISVSRAKAFGTQVVCGLSSGEASALRGSKNSTRSAAGIEKAAMEHPTAIFAVGNAPTALYRLLELVDEGVARPSLIIGVVVGFVDAVESKTALMERNDLPWISCEGNRGGSSVAASCVNALIRAACGEI